MRDLLPHLPVLCALLAAALPCAANAEDKYDESLRTYQIKEHTNTGMAVAISPDAKTLATAGKDKSIRFFDLATGKRTNIIRHEAEIWSVGYSGDGKTFAFSDGDKNVIVVDAGTLKETATLKDFEAPVAMLALSPDGSLLATIEDGLQVPHIWELPSGKSRAVLEGHGDRVYSVAFSPDGKHVASAGGDETIRIWEATAGIPGRPLRGHDGPVFTAVFAPDGKTLLSGGARQDGAAVGLDDVHGEDGDGGPRRRGAFRRLRAEGAGRVAEQRRHREAVGLRRQRNGIVFVDGRRQLAAVCNERGAQPRRQDAGGGA